MVAVAADALAAGATAKAGAVTALTAADRVKGTNGGKQDEGRSPPVYARLDHHDIQWRKAVEAHRRIG